MNPDPGDPLAEIAAIAEPAILLGIGTALLESAPRTLAFVAMPAPLSACAAFALGAFAGALTPCSTAAIALAALLVHSAPPAAAGILATAGLIPLVRSRPPRATRDFDGRASLVLLAAACAALAMRDGSGLVHPRLVPLLWLGVPGALLCLQAARTVAARHALAPGLMLAVLVLGSPEPRPAIVEGTWDGVYPGEIVRFTGSASFARERIVLVRYAITCCRADATPIVVTTDRRRTAIAGAWYCAEGVVASDGAQTYLRVRRMSRVAPPADPYLYR